MTQEKKILAEPGTPEEALERPRQSPPNEQQGQRGSWWPKRTTQDPLRGNATPSSLHKRGGEGEGAGRFGFGNVHQHI